jgi:hypothetical protein
MFEYKSPNHEHVRAEEDETTTPELNEGVLTQEFQTIGIHQPNCLWYIPNRKVKKEISWNQEIC